MEKGLVGDEVVRLTTLPPQQNCSYGVLADRNRWKGVRGVRKETEAYAENTPGLNLGVFGLERVDIARQGLRHARGRVLAKESAQVLLLLFGVGRVPKREVEG